MGTDEKSLENVDPETKEKKLPYPKAVFLIIVCEFCERFCYYGMRTILTLYFVQVIGWDDDTATVVYHVFVLFSYMTPLMGAMLADSLLGKFRTIAYLAAVYCIGCIVLSLACTTPLKIPTTAFSMVGLGLIALGTGGIKPCVSAFGADQFKLPEQNQQLESYFAIFYAAINSGSLVSTLLTPVLREDVKCFDEDHCYSLAFSIPGALMVVALFIFIIGRPLYKVNKPEGNVVLKVMSAIKHALSRRGSEVKAGRTREHWMDYADDKFDSRFISEAKVLLKVLFLYIPLPLFWALFDQQGSRWTLQATRMDGVTFGWTIKPDQLQVVNPILVLLLIPTFDRGIYPLLSKCRLLRKPLQRLVLGGIFAGIAFVVSGLVELSLEPTYAIELKNGESNIHLINSIECPIVVTSTGLSTYTILPNELQIYEAVSAKTYSLNFKVDGTECNFDEMNFSIEAESKVARSFILHTDPTDHSKMALTTVGEEDDLEKSKEGSPRMRVVFAGFDDFTDIVLQGDGKKHTFDYYLNTTRGTTNFTEIEPTEFGLSLTYKYGDNVKTLKFNETTLDMKLGAVYILSIVRDPTKDVDDHDIANFQIGLNLITKANSVHMLLLIPQYVIMTMGEIMFSITIMDFSYAEGPPSMKSVMQSAWLLTVAVGNLIVVIIAEAKIFDKQWKEFFLFAGLMFVDMAIFAYMAMKYVPADRFWLNDNEKAELEGKKGEDDKDTVDSKDKVAPEATAPESLEDTKDHAD